MNREQPRDSIDVAQNEMAREAVTPDERALQVDRVAGGETAESRATQRLGREIRDEPRTGGNGRQAHSGDRNTLAWRKTPATANRCDGQAGAAACPANQRHDHSGTLNNARKHPAESNADLAAAPDRFPVRIRPAAHAVCEFVIRIVQGNPTG